MGTISRTAPDSTFGAPLARHGGAFRGASSARRAVLAFANLMLVWQQRLRDRDILREMNDAQLADIGIRRADALHEAGKPFWRA